MANVTPEYLFQVIGELTVEGRLLRTEASRLQQELEAKDREIAGLQMEKAQEDEPKG